MRLPGVARKTANVVAAELGEPQGIVVDTHVRRLSQRLGLTKQEDPVKIERDLIKIVPREDWGRFPHLLIWHGRRVCLARLPALRGVCPERPLPVVACLSSSIPTHGASSSWPTSTSALVLCIQWLRSRGSSKDSTSGRARRCSISVQARGKLTRQLVATGAE